MEERNISPQESLDIIQKMISNSRYKASESGFHLIVWSIVISIASILQYLMIVIRSPYLQQSWWMWIGAVILGVVIGNVYEAKKSKTIKVEKNTVNKVIDFIWLSFGVCSVLIWFFAWKHRVYDITPLIHISLGFATLITGILLQYKPLIRGGIIFWISGIACIIVSSPINLLINAAALMIGFLIPGISLWNKYKKEHHV